MHAAEQDRAARGDPAAQGLAKQYLTRRETRDLLDKVDPLFRDLVLLTVRTGMHLGELRVGDIDLRARGSGSSGSEPSEARSSRPRVTRRERFRSRPARSRSYAVA
jgi:hypothetical protein